MVCSFKMIFSNPSFSVRRQYICPINMKMLSDWMEQFALFVNISHSTLHVTYKRENNTDCAVLESAILRLNFYCCIGLNAESTLWSVLMNRAPKVI